MIKVTRLNGKEFVVNAEQIEFIESTPDTVISLISGKKIVVNESVEEIIDSVVKYKGRIHSLEV
ncbi:MAG: Flagellar protein FlbD [Firmicutes bacterium]|nr:Flagellar protein FlbD [Bacillota bacterium]MDI6704675.1 flagellar FlbD family protein [Bacillota bacterium]